MKKDLREKALKDMHRNYSAAAVTLVHDCFLRGCEWRDAESAAFYIVMSPWFSRGWTALELKDSTRVKIIFKDRESGGLVTKDLDDDILQVGSNPSAPQEHNAAKEIIGRLRGKKINQLNDLVAVLGSRHTSWPRDIAIISGLMIGIQMPEAYSHQKIYQEILQEIGEVSYAHLFHNSATMSHGYNWCPTSLYELPVTSRRESLQVEKNGNLFGKWDIMSLDLIEDEKFISGHSHPLVAAKVQLARQKKDRYILLVEPELRVEGTEVSRALLVEPLIRKNGDYVDCYCDYVGPVYFNPPLETEDVGWTFSFNNIHIGHDMENHRDHRIQLEEKRSAQWTIEEMKIGSADSQARKRDTSPRDSDLQKDRKSKDWSEFLKSVIDDVYEKAEALLDVVDNPNRADRDGWSILHHAIWNGRTRISKLLIAKLDLQRLEKSHLGEEPLHLAVERGNQELVVLLLKHSTPNLPRKDGLNALHLAARQEFVDIVDKLLEKGWELNATEPNEKRTALHMASFRGHQDVLAILTKQNTQLDLKDKYGQTAFSIAVRNGHEKTALLLKEAGADVHLRDESGNTLLHLEATGVVNAPRGIRILCRIGVDLEAGEYRSMTALHLVAFLNRVPAINALLEGDRKANIDARDDRKMTPLHIAASNGHIEATKRLIELRADLEAQDSLNRTPLHLAAFYGRIEIIDALLNGDGRAKIEARDNRGMTPLLLTMKMGKVDATRKLIELGADTEAQNIFSHNAQHLAASRSRVLAITALLNGTRRAKGEN